jgi:uncharacterized protein (TIGR00251 family)
VIRSTPEGVTLDVRVIPRAKKTEIGGTRDGALLVRLNAPPVEGAANGALVAFLADLFHTSRSSIRIVSGERGRRKRVAIAGITPDRVRDILDACSPTS